LYPIGNLRFGNLTYTVQSLGRLNSSLLIVLSLNNSPEIFWKAAKATLGRKELNVEEVLKKYICMI
jgi:hypothetical protein